MSALEIDRLVEAIYDGVHSAEALAAALAAIRSTVLAHACLAFQADQQGPTLWYSHEVDLEAFGAYEAHYYQHDLYKDALLASGRLRSGAVFTEQTLVTPEAIRRSPLVQELLLPNDLGPILGCPAHVDAQGNAVEITFFRPPNAAPFAAGEIAFLNALAPHLARAARLRLRLGDTASMPAWSAELLDGLAWGVVILDRAGRTAFVNGEARRILTARDGLTLRASGLHAEHKDDARGLRDAIARAVHRQGGTDLLVRRPSGAPAYLLTIVPLPEDQAPRSSPVGPGVAVHILDANARPRDRGRRLTVTFGLTPAEQKVALDLAHEFSLAAIAERHGVAPSTVKSHLLSLFAKTGTNRQSQLVALLGRLLSLPHGERSEP
jgi:DNA-binding CsgD family transcriptional regulator